jgi:hypothetical protein
MRTLNQQEVQSVAGAGILTSTLSTAVQAGKALGTGFVALGSAAATAGKIVATPVVKVGVSVIKILI